MILHVLNISLSWIPFKKKYHKFPSLGFEQGCEQCAADRDGSADGEVATCWTSTTPTFMQSMGFHGSYSTTSWILGMFLWIPGNNYNNNPNHRSEEPFRGIAFANNAIKVRATRQDPARALPLWTWSGLVTASQWLWLVPLPASVSALSACLPLPNYQDVVIWSTQNHREALAGRWKKIKAGQWREPFSPL